MALCREKYLILPRFVKICSPFFHFKNTFFWFLAPLGQPTVPSEPDKPDQTLFRLAAVADAAAAAAAVVDEISNLSDKVGDRPKRSARNQLRPVENSAEISTK